MTTNSDIMRAIGHLQGTVDGIVRAEQARAEAEAARDARIAAVEKRQWYHSGGVAVIAFFLAKVGIPLPKF